MKKSSDALRTISEVANDLDIPKHVLRFWESKFTQIRPMKRGGGRRYYRPADIRLLQGIRHLLYGEGFTIRGVQQIFKRDGIDHVKSYANSDISLASSNYKKPEEISEKIIKARDKDKVKPSRIFSNIHPKQKILLSILDEIDSCRKVLEKA